MIDITAAAIATLISSVVATTVAIKINNYNSVKSLNDQLDNILKIAIQYPYLESPTFCDTWIANKGSEDDRYLRYENYCTLIFNYLERLCTFHKFNLKNIEKKLNVKGWIRVHKACWQQPSVPFENADSYDTRFRNIIDNYIK
ncbi:MAG TPA: hypothetical protein VNW95_01630 [Mucilaginibacter sp.]|jgi:hypothetical protein|nr:hypothetical protein [Mucilaginibacter sp.]